MWVILIAEFGGLWEGWAPANVFSHIIWIPVVAQSGRFKSVRYRCVKEI